MDEAPRLFKLRSLLDFSTEKCTFCENGRRKIFAASSADSLYFCLIENNLLRSSKCIPWDMKSSPVVDLCFDSSGSWLLLLCPTALHIIPSLAFLDPTLKHDLKWPIDEISSFPLEAKLGKNATAVVWWQTKTAEPVAIIGDQTGGLTFFSLDTSKVMKRLYIIGKVVKLIIYIDDELDCVILLINSKKNRQWSYLLENRSTKDPKKVYSTDKDKKPFLEFINSAMANMISSCSSDCNDSYNSMVYLNQIKNNPTPVSVMLAKMVQFDDSSTPKASEESDSSSSVSQWLVNPQSADGRHFLSILNTNHNSFTLHSKLDDQNPMYSYKFVKLPTNFVNILWQQKIIFILGSNNIEIHSCFFSSQKEPDIHSSIWEDEFEDDEIILDGWTMNQSNASANIDPKWTGTTEIEELIIPRFNLGSCLIVTNKKIYVLSTSCDPSDWLIEQLVTEQGGVERMAAALKVHLNPIMVAAGDLLLARKKIKEALNIYNMTKISSDEILLRYGASDLYSEISTSGIVPQSSYAADICLLNHIYNTLQNKEQYPILLEFLKSNNSYTVPFNLNLFAQLGLWDAISIIHSKGNYWLSFYSLVFQRFDWPCRGFFSVVLNKHYTPFLITDVAHQLLKYIDKNCGMFDITLLKRICVWMCPLQDCFRILFKALSTAEANSHLSGMRRLIRSFFGVISTLHARISMNTDTILIPTDKPSISNLNKDNKERHLPCALSCGYNFWGITNGGKVKITSSNGFICYTNIDTNLIGKALSISCGRDHLLILSENGLYAMGDNQYGQLGVGSEVSVCSQSLILVGVMGKMHYDGSFAWYGEKVVQISAGQYHSACVTDNGSLYTWGWGVHGQLAHGIIYNEFIPRRVSTMNSEKIIFVGCGCCHTAVLTQSGFVYVCGNNSFGQIGDSGRQKSNIPLKVDLGSIPVTKITVGYFHTFALLKNNELWTWGSSPQKLRLGVKSAKRKATGPPTESQDDFNLPSSPIIEENNHLYPTQVDTTNVKGKIVAMAAGRLHSCLIDNYGLLYVWGLNLDSQLGTNNRNEIFIPTQVEVDPPPSTTTQIINYNKKMLPNVACGDYFTVYVNPNGKIYYAGASYVEDNPAKQGKMYFVKFKNKTTKIRFSKKHNTIAQFKHVSEIDNTSQVIQNRTSIEFKWPLNPILTLDSFDDPNWASPLLRALHQFIDDDTPLMDNHLRALHASLRSDYSEALNIHLNNLFVETQEDAPLYLTHTYKNVRGEREKKGNVEDLMIHLQEKIKEISKYCLGEEVEKKLFDYKCLCTEYEYLTEVDANINPKKEDVSDRAIYITKSILSSLPPNSEAWTECVNEATKFWLHWKFNIEDLENVLKHSMANGRAVEVASVVFCSKDSVDYQKHLSSAFNLELCDSILQSW